MEPDIIHMYSSSPPPLDNGAEDDEDEEFGEFGGFSEVESPCVGFADFGAPDYSNSKEDFIPPNHFMPIRGYSDVHSLSSTKTDEECYEEFSVSTVGQSNLLESKTCNEIIQLRTSNSPFDGRSPDSINERVQQKEHFVKQEHISPQVFRPEVNCSKQDHDPSNCNGNKVPCLEILTNGFAVSDTTNPEGIEDLVIDRNSKGLKCISTRNTTLGLDSISSHRDVFASSTTFSNKNAEQQAHRELGHGNVPKNQDNHLVNRVDEQSTAKLVSDPRTRDNDDQSELETVQVCLSGDNAPCREGEEQWAHTLASSECETVVCSSILLTSSKSARQDQGVEDIGGTEKDVAESKVREPVNVNASRTYGSAEIVTDSHEAINEENKIGQMQTISSVNVEGLTNRDLGKHFATSTDANEDDFVTVINAVPPSHDDAQDSNGDMFLGSTSKQFPQLSSISGVELSTDSHHELSEQPTVDTLSDLNYTENKFSDFPVQPFASVDKADDGNFGDFDSVPTTQERRATSQDFDDFADFSSASSNQGPEWNAFEDEQKGSAWAAFDNEQAVDCFGNEEEPWQPYRTEMPIASEIDQASKDAVLPTSHKTEPTVHDKDSTAVFQTSLLGRLERMFHVCFPSILIPEVEEIFPTLEILLEEGEKKTKEQVKLRESPADSGKQLDVWMELQNIHDGYGLRYQWGGSHSNKMLLRSLGIDTRNILFTGNKKQPVIVPMYASGLGMLEPTKEPLKPVSAAEKITSIGHTPPVSPEVTPSDQLQESLPPVQFDWSSSGLTNPLDGVDPELYELTTSKLESSTTSSKGTDAFAKLMSTVEKTSTSTRKPKKEEHLSEEAAKVIASLPDLSFMHAKVLMFPATLTPSTSCQEK